MRRIGLTLSLMAVAAGVTLLVIGTAAAGSQPRSGAPGLLQDGSQIAAGGAVFQEICSACHGERGQGIDDAPAIVGPGNALADYRTAARLYTFISGEMPDDDPGSLTSQQYYDVLAYLLDQNGMNPDGRTIDPTTAESMSLNP